MLQPQIHKHNRISNSLSLHAAMSLKPTTPNAKSRDARRKLLRSSGVYKILPQSPKIHYPQHVLPLASESNKQRLQALAESIEQLETNMGELANIHNAVNSGFNEPFASFLYGLLITMFCNNFPGCPTRDAFENKQNTASELRLNALQERVRVARAENQRLRLQLALKSSQARTFPSAEMAAKRTLLRPNPASRAPATPLAGQRRVMVAHDDTYSTNDSFVDVPRRGAKPALGTKHAGSSPNLNQPPRYMRGLFDKSASANIRSVDAKSRARGPTSSSARRQVQRPSRLSSRPPFR